jgi:hypothetical protein
MNKTLLSVTVSVLSFFALTGVSYAAIVTCGNTVTGGVTRACNFNDFINFINNGIKLIIGYSAVIATITFTIAGARILLKPDNSGEREAAKEMFWKTVKGFFFLFCGFLIVKLIVQGLGVNETATGIFKWLKF